MTINSRHLQIATAYQLLGDKVIVWWREVSPTQGGWMALSRHFAKPRWHEKNDYLLLAPGLKPIDAKPEDISLGDRHYHHPSRVRARMQKAKP